MSAEVPFHSGFFYIDRYYKNVQKNWDIIGDPQLFRDQNWRHKLGWGQCFGNSLVSKVLYQLEYIWAYIRTILVFFLRLGFLEFHWFINLSHKCFLLNSFRVKSSQQQTKKSLNLLKSQKLQIFKKLEISNYISNFFEDSPIFWRFL